MKLDPANDISRIGFQVHIAYPCILHRVPGAWIDDRRGGELQHSVGTAIGAGVDHVCAQDYTVAVLFHHGTQLFVALVWVGKYQIERHYPCACVD